MNEQAAIAYVLVTVISILMIFASIFSERGFGTFFKVGIIFMMIAALIKFAAT